MHTTKTPRKKVGITGAAGNIGKTLREGLSDKYDLCLYDFRELKVSPPHSSKKLDCADGDALQGAFQGLDCLIHLAGNPHPDAPRKVTMRNNFRGTSLCLHEAKRSQVRKVVLASSNFFHEGDIGAFLRGETSPLITLDHPPTPISLYGQSKVYAENLGRHYAYLGMPCVALRIGWTVPEDSPVPYDGDYMRAVFCSKRDLIAAFTRALEVETDFLAAFAVSNNRRGIFDLKETRDQLGFEPQDDAENYF